MPPISETAVLDFDGIDNPSHGPVKQSFCPIYQPQKKSRESRLGESSVADLRMPSSRTNLRREGHQPELQFEHKIPESDPILSHQLYYEIYGSGPRKVLLIQGLGITCMDYAGQIMGHLPPLLRPQKSLPNREPKLLALTSASETSSISSSSLTDSIYSSLSNKKDPWGPEYTVCVYDHRGVGKSEIPVGESIRNWKVKGMARDTLMLLRHLGWVDDDGSESDGHRLIPGVSDSSDQRRRKVHVVGNSLGGMIALELATMIPDQIKSLILCGTMAGKRGGIGNLPGWKGFHSVLKQTFSPDPITRAHHIFSLCFPSVWLSQPSPHNPDLTNRQVLLELYLYRKCVLKENPPAAAPEWAAGLAVLGHHVSASRLRTLSVIPKICILTGGQDHLIDKKHSDHLKRSIVGGDDCGRDRVEKVVWEDAGHGLNLQFLERYEDLLRRVWVEAEEKVIDSKGTESGISISEVKGVRKDSLPQGRVSTVVKESIDKEDVTVSLA